MPLVTDLNDYFIFSGNDNKFRIRTGREIYNSFIIGELNRIPIQKISSFVLSTLRDEPDSPLDLDETLERLLIDGSLGILQGEFLPDILECTDTKLVHILDRQKGITRVYELDTQWTLRDYVNYQGEQQKQLETSELPIEYLYIYPNGKGLLYPAQRTLYRLQSIAETLEANSEDYSLSLILHGFLGELADAENKLRDKKKILAVPSNVTATEVDFTKPADRLLKEFEQWLPLYFQSTHVVEIDESKSGISGISKRLSMLPFLRKVKQTQNQLVEIFRAFGVELEFSAMELDSITEDTQRYNLLKSMWTDGVYTESEFHEKAKNLFKTG